MMTLLCVWFFVMSCFLFRSMLLRHVTWASISEGGFAGGIILGLSMVLYILIYGSRLQ